MSFINTKTLEMTKLVSELAIHALGIKELEIVKTENAEQVSYRIIIFNDEVNTFDWVIACLVEICQHTTDQAEQCAWIIHTKGKYAVKHGSFKTLEPICTALCDRGLSASIEDV